MIDGTLYQLVTSLVEAERNMQQMNAQNEELRRMVATLEGARNGYDHELGERSRVNLELRDRIAELERHHRDAHASEDSLPTPIHSTYVD